MKLEPKATSNSFEFTRLDGTTFSARYAPFTGARMDAMVKVLKGYTDLSFRVDQLLDTLTISPELLDSDESLKKAKPLLSEYLTESADKEKIRANLIKLFGGSLSDEDISMNMLCHRKFIQIMVLETVLSEDDLALVKSDVASDFWGNQLYSDVKSAGESFRLTVLNLAK
jgi:hypothetical protein